jgi:hypothetical protein
MVEKCGFDGQVSGVEDQCGESRTVVDKCRVVDRCGGRWGMVENGEKMRTVVVKCGCGGEV